MHIAQCHKGRLSVIPIAIALQRGSLKVTVLDSNP